MVLHALSSQPDSATKSQCHPCDQLQSSFSILILTSSLLEKSYLNPHLSTVILKLSVNVVDASSAPSMISERSITFTSISVESLFRTSVTPFSSFMTDLASTLYLSAPSILYLYTNVPSSPTLFIIPKCSISPSGISAVIA